MNKLNILKYLAMFLAAIFLMSGCEKDLEPTFTGKLRGKIVDQNGNIVSGNTTTDDLLVLALGENDIQEMRIRVIGDGTFANTNLYEQSYQVWITGAVIAPPEARVDLAGGADVNFDIVVTPFITIPSPGVVGVPSSDKVTINFSMTGNAGHTVEERSVFVSTVSYPSRSTGSGPYWSTIRRDLMENQGEITIDGLKSDTKYYVRVTARAQGTNFWNTSDQIVFTTP